MVLLFRIASLCFDQVERLIMHTDDNVVLVA
jgi:hypothetical protein